MRETLINQEIILAEDARLVKRLWKVAKSRDFPQGLEFSYQLLFFDRTKWIQIARIDNQMHGGKQGTHIHIFGRRKVKWEDLAFEEAEKRVLGIGERMLRSIRGRKK